MDVEVCKGHIGFGFGELFSLGVERYNNQTRSQSLTAIIARLFLRQAGAWLKISDWESFFKAGRFRAEFF